MGNIGLTSMSDPSAFHPGGLVRLKSQPDTCGAVIAVNISGPEIQYTVLLDGKPRTFFASQLIADQQESDATQRLSADECRAFFGRSRGRSMDSRPSVTAMRFTH